MKTKNPKALMALCYLSIQLLTFSTAAMSKEKGGMDGGGGGVYKIKEGQYMTLPEAGVLIGDGPNGLTGKKFQRYYKISEEAQKELNGIIKKIDFILPGQNLYTPYIVADRDSFVILKDVDMNEYGQIKKEYRKALNSYGYELDDEKFVLPAFSTRDEENGPKGKTYILPDFTLMTARQQAMILIHEYNMRRQNFYGRSREEMLRRALAVDVQINKIVNENDLLNFDSINAIKHFAAANLIQNSDATRLILLQMQRKINRPILQEELFARWDGTEIDSSLVQDLQEKYKLNLNYSEILEGVNLRMDSPSEYFDHKIRIPLSKKVTIELKMASEDVLAYCQKWGKDFENKKLFLVTESTEGGGDGMYTFRCIKKGLFKYEYSDVQEFLVKDEPFFFREK